jgi:hypothetical protein
MSRIWCRHCRRLLGPVSLAGMSATLIALTGCAYLYVALEQASKGNWPMTVCYLGYAFANVGLYLMAK